MRLLLGSLLALIAFVLAQNTTSSMVSSAAQNSTSVASSTAASSPTGALYSNNPNIGITATINMNTMTYSYTGKPLITVAPKSGYSSASLNRDPRDAVKTIAVAGLFAMLACVGAALI